MEIQALSPEVIQDTSDTGVRSAQTVQRAYNNAPGTVQRSQGTLSRLMDSISRSLTP